MSGLKLTIPTTFTNINLPYLRDDAVLPRQGAMMLLDATHPANPWAAGVPANGAVLPNIAESQSLAMVGSTSDNNKMKMVRPAGNMNGTNGLLERSTKGGLHGIIPNSGAHAQFSGAVLQIPIAQLAYILANRSHDYYMSSWFRITRRQINGYSSGTSFGINGSAQQTNSYLFHAFPGATTASEYSLRPNVNPPRLGLTPIPANDSSAANKFLALATDQWWTSGAGVNNSVPGDGTATSTTGNYAGGGIPFGSAPNSWAGVGSTGVVTSGTDGIFSNMMSSGFVPAGGDTTKLIKDSLHSQLVYRLYLEDLTVSGRTFAEVSALDSAEYTKHVLTAGGRYFGDTFTNPSTLP